MLLDEEQGRFVASHHPFTAPVEEDIPLLDSDPKAVRGQHYDLVLNGVELGGGSIRIHQPDVQKKVFEDVLKIEPDVVESRFGYMLKAFEYGAPPHGGIAFGLDRMVAILSQRSSIRDVIAFPKNQKGQEMMTASRVKPLRASCVICISRRPCRKKKTRRSPDFLHLIFPLEPGRQTGFLSIWSFSK